MLKIQHRNEPKGVIKFCRYCGAPFVQPDRWSKFQYCSRECAKRGRRRSQRIHSKRKRRWREYQKPDCNNLK